VKSSFRDSLVIALVGIAALLPGLGAMSLWDYDEALWAGTAAEMGRRGTWIVPYFNGELSIQKPPFMYWMMLLGTGVFGEGDFAYRIGSALFGVATCLLTYRLGTTLFDRGIGLVAATAMATATMFDVVSRGATPDAELTFFCTLALSLFVHRVTAAGWPPPGRIGGFRWQAALPMYAAMGCAVLTKGPIGFLLPTLAIGLFLVLHDARLKRQAGGGAFVASCLRAAPGAAWGMRPLTAVLAVALVVGPWFILVQQQTGGAFAAGFIGTHNIQRFLQPFERHTGSILYYVPAMLLGFFPWSMFAIPTVIETVRRIRGRLPGDAAALLLAVWFATWFGFFSLAQTKLPNYIVPAFPAAAILTASFLVRWARAAEASSRIWMTTALTLLIACGLAAGAVCLTLPRLEVNGTTTLASLGLAAAVGEVLASASVLGWIMAGGGIACLALAVLDRRRAALAAYAGMSIAWTLVLFTVTAVEADRHQPTPRLVDLITSRGDKPPVAQHRYSYPSLVHYSRAPVEQCQDAAAISAFFARHPQGCMVVAAENADDLRDLLPAETEVVGEQPAFPKAGRVFVVRGTADAAAAPSGPRLSAAAASDSVR